jgi:gamma-glutamyl:cysteine ligase YbdK (ATP-grasp superfamily)
MTRPLALLEGVGLELELMLVDEDTLDVRPIADQLLFAASGGHGGDHDAGRIGWSNELVLHVIELKMNAPERGLGGIPAALQENVRAIEAHLAPLGARLMPTGMHPWMDPRRETRLWPHAWSEVYHSYHRLFDCARHGWANLQSTHLNLSFGDERDFARLHAAARLVLPLVPALAASSPLVEGRPTGALDNRLLAYRSNAERVPSMAGAVIPEPVFDFAGYRRVILEPIERVLAPLEPEGILRGEWLNARGAIARFERMALELRLADAQECPLADVAVAWATTCVVRALCQERWASTATQQGFATRPLAELLASAVRRGPAARIAEHAYARALGWRERAPPPLGELWQALVEEVVAPDAGTPSELLPPLQTILRAGTLSERILRALGEGSTPARVAGVYRELCQCLREGRQFQA